MKKRVKVLCICTMGANRSRYLASYLKNKGYNTRFGGVGPCRVDPEPTNPAKAEDVEWADVIITARKKHEPVLKEKFNVKGKRIIALDIPDSRRKIGQKYPEFNNLEYHEFQKKWTYPQLRKALKPYLPLK